MSTNLTHCKRTFCLNLIIEAYSSRLFGTGFSLRYNRSPGRIPHGTFCLIVDRLETTLRHAAGYARADWVRFAANIENGSGMKGYGEVKWSVRKLEKSTIF